MGGFSICSRRLLAKSRFRYAVVAELVYALVLGTSLFGDESSSLSDRTKRNCPVYIYGAVHVFFLTSGGPSEFSGHP